MMGKRFFACLFILLLFIPLYSLPSLYFRLNDRCTLIDLESDKYLGHTLSSVYDDIESVLDSSGKSNTGYYYRDQSMASIGLVDITYLNNIVANAGGTARLVVTVNNSEHTADDWYYTLIEDRRYKRHMGIDLFSRGHTNDALNHDTYIIDGSGNTGIHAGNGFATNTYSIDLFENGTAIYKSAWFDVTLVVDDIVDANDQLIAADSYYIVNLEFEIKVVDANGVILQYNSEPLYEKYYVQVMGYYRPEDESFSRDNTAIFYIERQNNDISISDEYGGNWFDIATYYFTTDAKSASLYNAQNPGNVYIFLSSSSDGRNNSATPFTLKRKRGPVIEGQSAYSTEIGYLARLVSDGNGTGHAYGSSSRATVSSDGTSYFLENNDGFKANSLVIDANTFKDKQGTYVRWYDQGSIQIKIPTDENLFDEGSGKLLLKSGSYESTIYVHIITDFIPKNPN